MHCTKNYLIILFLIASKCPSRFNVEQRTSIMSFAEKVVLITGASAGIGAATAVHFARLGASLALVGRNTDHLQRTADLCTKVTITNGVSVSAPPLIISADVNTDAQRIVSTTIEHYGRLNVLVNNVGIGGVSTIETTQSLEHYDTIMATNVRSVFELTMLAVPYLIATGGNIVNVSSSVSLRPIAGSLVYGISKAALDQFTRNVALELAPRGVRCNSVNPAVIATDFHRNFGMSEDAYQAFREHCKRLHPIGRVGQPEEVAAAITFLANNTDAGFVTGTLLPIDGGKVL